MNLLITMLLGGLWHGAGWTFLVWGGLHGIYLTINHGWRALRQRLGADPDRSSRMGRLVAQAITFLAVTVAWVFFRSRDFHEALAILQGMAGVNGFLLPESWLTKAGDVGPWLAAHGVQFVPNLAFGGGQQILWIAALLAIAWFAPNSQQLLVRYAPVIAGTEGGTDQQPPRFTWRPGIAWALAVGVIGFAAISSMAKPQVFLYFQF